MDGAGSFSRNVTLGIKNGLHLAPISKIVQQSTEYSSSIRIRFGAKEADAKSVVDLMLLGATHGAPLVVEASGNDAELAVSSVAEILAGGVVD
jgi:phosphotransferase system HPr (HPr) family protein